MNLVKKYNEDKTITISIVDSSKKEVLSIKRVVNASKGMIVVSTDDSFTAQEAQWIIETIQSKIEEVLSSGDSFSIIAVPDGVKIDYINF